MTVENFKARYPQFKDLESEAIEPVLIDSKLSISLETFKDKAEIAIFLLVAHELTLFNSIDGKDYQNKIISRSIEGGGVTLAYKQPTDSIEAYYQKTIYGEKFLALRKTVRFVGAVLT